MGTAESVLVIIVSSVLSIFLILLIVLVVMVIKLVSKIKRVVTTAEKVIDNAEAAAETLKNASGPLAALKVLYNIVNKVR